MTATTCPDCEGLGYLGGEDTPSSCMNKWHKLARNESIERVAQVAKERQVFNEHAELKDREAIVAWLRRQYDNEIEAMQSKWSWNDLIFHEAKALAYDHAANAIATHPTGHPQGDK